MAPLPLFEFYEVVTLLPCPQLPAALWGATAFVVGRSEELGTGWEYGVIVPADHSFCWQLREECLSSQGTFVEREQVDSGKSIRVAVDPLTGAGRVVVRTS